jgi:hypothetical protein
MTHLDTDVLAEFRAGLITGRRGAKIAAHLAGCDRCTALDDQLAGVSALLASVPAPAMPDGVALRLDAALAAEVARMNDPERARPEPSPEPAASPRRPRRHGFRLMSLRVLAPAAAAVVVLAGGGYGLSLLTSRGGQMTASSSAAGTEGRAASRAPGQASGANPAAGAAEPTAGTQEPAASPFKGARISPANFPFVVSGVTFSSAPATLRQQVESALRGPRSSQAAPSPVRACVQNLAGGHPVVLVESGRFAGRPATLVVAGTGQHDTAWIAGPDCSATIRDVLATTSLPPGIS